MNDDEFIKGLCSLDEKTIVKTANFLMLSANYLINELTEKDQIPLEKQVPDIIITHSFEKFMSLSSSLSLEEQIKLVTNASIIDNYIQFLTNQPTKINENGHIINPSMELAAKLVNTLLAPLTLLKNQMETIKIKKSITVYRNYLAHKIRCLRGDVIHDLIAIRISDVYSQKMSEHYGLISALDAEFEDKVVFTHRDKEKIRAILSSCLKNMPSWREKPFLQELSDFFNVRFNTLRKSYIPFYEDKYISNVEDNLNKHSI